MRSGRTRMRLWIGQVPLGDFVDPSQQVSVPFFTWSFIPAPTHDGYRARIASAMCLRPNSGRVLYPSTSAVITSS